MKQYRSLTAEEISRLEAQHCMASDWSMVKVTDGFRPDHIHHIRFSGEISLGCFATEFRLAGGITKHYGL